MASFNICYGVRDGSSDHKVPDFWESVFLLSGIDKKNPVSLHEILMNRKREVMDAIKQNFARYGDRVCDLITRESQKTNGLQNILLKLGISGVPRFDHQVTRLAQFLAQNGKNEFVRQMERDSPGIKSGQGREAGRAEVRDDKPTGEFLKPVDEPGRDVVGGSGSSDTRFDGSGLLYWSGAQVGY